jgi:chaperonin GroEL
LHYLGPITRVFVKKPTKTLIGGHTASEEVASRIKEIEAQLKNAKSDYDKKKFQERLAKLGGGVAVIKVGAMSETELKDKKLRIEDALNATKAAVLEGIVPGGGSILVEIQQELKQTLKDANTDIQRGIQAVLDSLTSPVYQIAENAGFNGNDIVEEQKKQPKEHGFDALAGQWVNLLTAGIIDPTKVTRSAVLNASMIAALFITSQAAVVKLEEAKPATPPMPEY